MPLYDRACSQCGHVEIDVWEKVQSDAPLCPQCGDPMARAWLSKASAIVPDSMHHWMTNGTKVPILFESKQEFKRWKKEHGYGDRVRHIGVDGSDKSKHTTRWEAMDAYTLNNARILLERAAQQPTRNEPVETPVKVKSYYGDVGGDAWREFRGSK